MYIVATATTTKAAVNWICAAAISFSTERKDHAHPVRIAPSRNHEREAEGKCRIKAMVRNLPSSMWKVRSMKDGSIADFCEGDIEE